MYRKKHFALSPTLTQRKIFKLAFIKLLSNAKFKLINTKNTVIQSVAKNFKIQRDILAMSQYNNHTFVIQSDEEGISLKLGSSEVKLKNDKIVLKGSVKVEKQ